MRVLDIGAGPASQADVQVDMFKWNDKVIVHDIVDTPWHFALDDEFDEVRAEQVLEHIPAVAYFYKDGGMTHINPRVEVMKQIHRVLRKNGILHASVPVGDDGFRQDPTHIGPRWTEGMFNYFCGEWGGNTPGTFSNDAYGIDFAFKKIEAFMTGEILTVKLMKI